MSEFPVYGKWPPTQSTCYVSLAAISKKDITKEEADEFTMATLHGDIDQILKRKRPVKIEHVLQTESGQRPKCVLVEGGPGVGKTTFSWEVCKRWGKGELFQEYTTVVLLQLRGERVQSAKRVSDLFYYTDEEVQRQIAAEITSTNGQDTLLVLDGLDELPKKLLIQDSVFGRLFSGTDLPLATLLVTSRPSVTGTLLSTWKLQVSSHVEILGFMKESIFEYSKSVLHDDEFLGFQEYLTTHPNIRTLMYVPLNSAIVTEVYKHSRQSSKPAPTTVTQLYTSLAHTLLLRYLDSHPDYRGQDLELNTFSDLPSPVYAQFQKLCEMAFNKATEKQVVFSDLGKSFEHFGFMHATVEIFGPRGASVSHSFLHFTIQEYLAAVHISNMSPKEQMDLFVEHFFQGRLRTCERLLHLPPVQPPQNETFNTWKFVSGLTQLNGFDLSLVLEQLYGTEHGITVDSAVIELLYETQNTRCLRIFGDTTALYSTAHLSHSTSTALAYCIVHSNCTWTLNITWACNKIGSQHEALLRCGASRVGCIERIAGAICPHCLEKSDPCFLQGIKELDLFKVTSITFSDQDLFSVKEINKKTVKLESFVLCPNPMFLISDPPSVVNTRLIVDVIRSLTRLSTLKELVLQGFHTGVAEASALKEMLLSTHNQVLRTVTMGHCNIDDETVQQLAEGLCHNKTVKELNISHNHIGDTGMVAMAVALSNNNKIKQIDISHNPFGDDGAIALAEMLRTNTSLVQLRMVQYQSESSVSHEGVEALLDSLQHNQELAMLTLSDHHREYLKVVFPQTSWRWEHRVQLEQPRTMYKLRHTPAVS